MSFVKIIAAGNFSCGGAAVIAALACCTPTAYARSQDHVFDIKSTSLSLAIIEVGRQSGTPIATLIADLPLIRTPMIRGTMRVDQALKTLLAGTGFRYRKSRNGTYMIERVAEKRAAKKRPAAKVPPPRPASPWDGDAPQDLTSAELIIVTATKNDTPLSDYAGSAYVAEVGEDQARPGHGRGTGVLIDLMPVLSTSHLGPGRNKIYARAISDGSHNGFMQSNLGLYLGEQRLGFAAPDPNLQLFDMERVELLLGPHGTLYGSGAMAGVLRLQPKMPDLYDRQAAILVEGASVAGGAVGGTVQAMINKPIVTDSLAVRAVAYQISDPGYMDHIQNANPYVPSVIMDDSNHVQTRGARAHVRWQMGDTSILDANLTYQQIQGDDIAHAPSSAGSFQTDTPILQPYSNKIWVRSLAFRKNLGDWTLSSISGWVNQNTREIYYQGLAFDRLDYLSASRKIMLLSHEMRAVADWDRWNLSMGISALKNHSRTTDTSSWKIIAYGDRTSSILSYEKAVFGEVRRQLGARWTIMVGARLAHLWEKISINPFDTTFTPQPSYQRRWDILPSASLSWKSRSGHLLFAAYREGYRSSGMFPPDFMDLFNTGYRPAAPDSMKMYEIGYRFSGSNRFSASISGYRIDWKNRNSDMITYLVGGYAPDNTGDTRIWGSDAQWDWKPTSRLHISGGAAINNRPTLPKPVFPDLPDGIEIPTPTIPNIPHMTFRLGAEYRVPISQQWDLQLGAAMRHQGSLFGEFLTTIAGFEEYGVDVRLLTDKQSLWLKVSNLLNSNKNSYGSGNSFYYTATDKPMYTPLRPRTISIGASSEF